MNVNKLESSELIFEDGINHPDYFLWDAWSYEEAGDHHLYCLAVARVNEDGSLLDPTTRNDVPFHVRHFVSKDQGKSWLDAGVFQTPRPNGPGFDAKTIWSGSVTLLADGRKLVAYTGLKDCAMPQQFLQSMAIAISHDGYSVESGTEKRISCPESDWQAITNKGYFLSEPNLLGHCDGENGGPILAWRDPYLIDHDGDLHMFWCAKSSSHIPALGHATLRENDSGFVIDKLFEPVLMPDAEKVTQLELPKVIYDNVRNKFYLIIATCNRLFEGQPDSEVDKQIRLYESASLNGPWHFHFDNGSSLGLGAEHMFGMTILNADFEKAQLNCISPYTEASTTPLTFSKTFSINLKP